MNEAQLPVQSGPSTRSLDVAEVFRRTRMLDPECRFEAVAQYVREINDMAQDLRFIASDDRSETLAHVVVRPEGAGL